MFSRIFIYRPVLALVISIFIALIGVISIPVLPIENTPDITPPTVEVQTRYPGASAPVIAETVAVPLEQEVNGVDDMIYMQSKSSDDGSMNLTITFEIGTDIDMATVLVQNRVAIAQPKLPEETKRQGVTTKKKSSNMVLMVNLISSLPEHDEIYISNYINLNIKDQLGRISGVANVQVMGAKDYGMRIWLDPERLKARALTTNDVVRAIREQNVQVAAGQIGAPPSPMGLDFQYTVNTLGRLSTVEEFEDIILKVDGSSLLRLSDVARVELGAQAYNWYVQLNGQPSIGMAIYQLPGANALEIADGVTAAMDEMATRFPDGLEYKIAFDSTRAIDASIAEVIETLFIAMFLVILTVYVFLQDVRTTLIPAVTIPVALLGTFGVMLAMGLSINTLSLFGIVLAIGIVVDDAIVVVENTMRLIDDEGLPPKEAAAKAMEQVTGPVIATTLVLLAVFV
ncbi:MAG: hydrophobe/amphiphile efflux-1 family RND transporter, partial [Acidobacteria bacterium]